MYFENVSNPTMDSLVHWFQIEFPELTQKMVDSNHAINNKEVNVYHVENSIWTHTMMVCMAARNSHKINKIAALLHDIGKPLSREIIPPKTPGDKTKARFQGHEGISFWLSIDPLCDLKQRGVINEEEMIEILTIISLHGTLFDRVKDGKEFKPEKIVNMFDTVEKFTRFVEQVKYDTAGRFHLGKDDKRFKAELGKDIYNDETFFKNINSSIIEKKQNKITLLIALPAGGKSTYVKNNFTNKTIISRDEVVMKYAKEKGLDYSEAFKSFTDEDHNNIDKEVRDNFNKAIKNKEDIVIDMTNMSPKARRKWLTDHNIRKNYNTKAIVFLAGESLLNYRNNKRKVEEGKFIPYNVYKGMMKSFKVPTLEEFDEIEFVKFC